MIIARCAHAQLAGVQAVAETVTGALNPAGCWHGPDSKLQTRSGICYEGTLQQGYMHGKASMQFPDGTCFDGSIAANTLTGPAVVSYEAMRYHGTLLDGQHHGAGVLEVMGGGAKYEGEFAHGCRHGTGTLQAAADVAHGYRGDWCNDQKHGRGTMKYASGGQYSGQWRHDQKCGFGAMQWTVRRERYRGFWADNQPSGGGRARLVRGRQPISGQPRGGDALQPVRRHVRGRAAARRRRDAVLNRRVLRDANIFTPICAGMCHARTMSPESTSSGQGGRHAITKACIMLHAGSRYEGEWAIGYKDGEGVFVFEDGSVWSGLWRKDQPVVESGGKTFGPAGAHPQVGVQDLLANEPDAEAAQRGALR